MNDEYVIRRYGYVYGKDSKEVIYYVKPWNNYKFEDGDSNFISLKQDKDGEWKVKTMEESIPEKVKKKDSGTLLHKYKESDEETAGDEYGFEDK